MNGLRVLPACVLIAIASPPGGVHAQRTAAERASHTQLMSELAQLRQAASYETAGNYAEAEKIVAEVLASNPTSLSGLLTMERLLSVQGRKPEILPIVDRLLAEDPASVIGHQTRLRVTSELEQVDRLEKAITEWVRITPDLETPYRESAVVWRNRGEPERAITLLLEGRKRIQRGDALALELGDAYAQLGDMRRTAQEWSRAVGPDGRGLMLVQRRLQMLDDGGAAVIPALVAQLSEAPGTLARQRAAATLAIEAGMEPIALRALGVLDAMAAPEDRQTLLVELARRAEGAGLHEVALAAYRRLLGTETDAGELLAIRTRIAELALQTGDTTLAAETYRQLEGASAAGSPQRRQAIALRIQLGARDGDVAAAVTDFRTFRSEFPGAPETDATAAALGGALLSAGRLEEAEGVLSGISGSQSALLRGRLHLRRGDIDRARQELLMAAPLLRGRDATAAIALATLLTRISPRGGDIVAGVFAALPTERPGAIDAAAAAARMLPAAERAAILDFLADAADAAGAAAGASELRREIVESLPRSHEAPGALLTLARGAAAHPETGEEARVLLEKLIVEYPRSALAPQARAELQRLQTHDAGRMQE